MKVLKLPPAEGNKLEQAFGLRLLSMLQREEIQWYAYEPIRLRLGEGSWYKPDFGALTKSDSFWLYEIKGFWREAARVRIKVAADRYPFFHFCAVTKKGPVWEFENFGRWK